MEYRELCAELFQTLRGARSQVTFSKQLGFSSNAAYAWENRRRQPELSALLRAGLLSNSDLKKELLEFLRPGPSELASCDLRSPRTAQLLVAHLAHGQTKLELAAELGVNRSTIGRWCAGTTDPKVPEFLHLVQLSTQRLLDFVRLFCDPATLESTQDAYQALEAQRRIAYDAPWSHAVLRALELDAYKLQERHNPELLGRSIGLSAAQVQAQLDALSVAEQIHFDGSHWRPINLLTVDTRDDENRDRVLKAHWAKTTLSRFEDEELPEDGLFSYNLFAISNEQYDELRQLHLDYYHRVRALVEAANTADRVVLMNLQLAPLEKRGVTAESAQSRKSEARSGEHHREDPSPSRHALE